jgi:hypothetical protein
VFAREGRLIREIEKVKKRVVRHAALYWEKQK